VFLFSTVIGLPVARAVDRKEIRVSCCGIFQICSYLPFPVHSGGKTRTGRAAVGGAAGVQKGEGGILVRA
jgi:hypothetical protein